MVFFDVTLMHFLHHYFFFQESKINVGVRGIFCVVQKAENGWWKRLLHGEGKPPHYVKVDWDKWVDEDEDDGMHISNQENLKYHVRQSNFTYKLIELPHCLLIRCRC